jgi:signal peptidase II
VNFQAMVNQGAVFGIGQGKRALFLTVSVAAILFIFYLFLTSDRQPFYQFVLGLLLAGVLGNLYDRLVLGYVRDMIYIFPGRIVMGREVFPWIFNVADSLLCVGVAMIFLYSLRGQPKKAAEPAKDHGAEGAVV